jgi:hypothetical protein
LDIEGYQPEGGKLKIMGMDIKRSDTPEFIQDFLEEVLDDALSGHKEQDVLDKIRDFKNDFKSLDPWRKGMPKRVNNLTMYSEKLAKKRKVDTTNVRLTRHEKKDTGTIPGHVRASINWNEFKTAMSDNYSMTITDGMKVIVCRLKPNAMGYTSIAYPTDEMHLPDWFKDLPFDTEAMEEAVLDKKISNVLGAMKWDLDSTKGGQILQTFFKFT